MSLPFGGAFLGDIEYILEIPVYSKFKVIEYFATIAGPHFPWVEFHIKIHGMAGKECVFSAQKAGKRSVFLKL